MLLLAGSGAAQGDTDAAGEPPEWAMQWLESRDDRSKRKDSQQEPDIPAPVSPEKEAARAQAAAQREARRHSRTAGGIAELQVWMRDLVRRGVGSVSPANSGSFDTMAARLVDAQAPALAQRIRSITMLPFTGDNWPARMLAELGRIHLLCEAFSRFDSLTPELQADVRTGLGWTVNQADLAATGDAVRDRWLVLARTVSDEERLVITRTWLLGLSSAQLALVLTFVYSGQTRESSEEAQAPDFIAGDAFEGELVFYPGAVPVRAVVRNRGAALTAFADPEAVAHQSFDSALQQYATALSRNPWIHLIPLLISGVTPTPPSDINPAWTLRDQSNRSLPVAPSFSNGWKLLVVSGARPITIFGEWNGDYFSPMAIAAPQLMTLT